LFQYLGVCWINNDDYLNLFCFDDKKLYRQATQNNTTVAKKCNFVAAKAFLKIVNFAKFEIEKRDDDDCYVKN